MRVLTFTSAFTGQLSSVQGVTLPGTKLRVEEGHVYRLEIEHGGQRGRLIDLTRLEEEHP